MAELNIKFWDISEWRKNLKFRSVRGAEEEEEEVETGKSIEKGKNNHVKIILKWNLYTLEALRLVLRYRYHVL